MVCRWGYDDSNTDTSISGWIRIIDEINRHNDYRYILQAHNRIISRRIFFRGFNPFKILYHGRRHSVLYSRRHDTNNLFSSQILKRGIYNVDFYTDRDLYHILFMFYHRGNLFHLFRFHQG